MSCLPRRVLSSLLIFVVLKRCQTSFISITRTAARRISSGWLVHYFDHLNLCASIRYSCLSCFILTLLILICLSVSLSFSLSFCLFLLSSLFSLSFVYLLSTWPPHLFCVLTVLLSIFTVFTVLSSIFTVFTVFTILLSIFSLPGLPL